MNLETQIRQVRARLSEPARTDPTDDRITDLEIVDWIHQSEIQCLRDLTERERLVTTATFAAVSAQELYTSTDSLPTDMLDIVRVTYAGVECVRHPVHELGALNQNSLYRPEKGFNQYFYELADSGGKTKLGIRPVPDDTSNIIVTYVKVPTRRYKHVKGTTTAPGSGTTIVDTTALTHPDDYWNSSEIRLVSGILAGAEKTVTDFAKATGTVTTAAWDATPGQDIQYEMGEVSDLQAEFAPMVEVWAAYIGFLKLKDDGQAAATKTEYDAYMGKHNARYGFTRTEPSRDGAVGAGTL